MLRRKTGRRILVLFIALMAGCAPIRTYTTLDRPTNTQLMAPAGEPIVVIQVQQDHANAFGYASLLRGRVDIGILEVDYEALNPDDTITLKVTTTGFIPEVIPVPGGNETNIAINNTNVNTNVTTNPGYRQQPGATQGFQQPGPTEPQGSALGGVLQGFNQGFQQGSGLFPRTVTNTKVVTNVREHRIPFKTMDFVRRWGSIHVLKATPQMLYYVLQKEPDEQTSPATSVGTGELSPADKSRQ